MILSSKPLTYTTFTLVALTTALFFALQTHAQSCHLITNPNQTPGGYASPVSYFTNDLMIKADCDTNQNISVTVGNNSPNTFIYQTSYRWTGSNWQAVTLEGQDKDGPWIKQRATKQFSSDQTPTYYVAYTCEYVGGQWKCGCTTQNCTQNQWQIQMVTPISVSQGGGNTTPSERDSIWESKGYDLFWSSTPSASDVGTDPKRWFRDVWSNGYPLLQYCTDCHKRATGKQIERVAIARAPDGTPSVKGFIEKGFNGGSFATIGQQLGPRGPEADVVFSTDYYNPCPGGNTPNLKSGSYIGWGRAWGAADNSTKIPAGSTNFDNAWSMRFTLDKRGDFGMYAYIPDKPYDHGRTYPKSNPTGPACNQWQTLEVEIVQNDIGKKNGILRAYIDGELYQESTGTYTRTIANVRPRGHGISLKHNSGAPKDETYYWKNWRIYLR